jgi:hypothetical protein
MAVKTAPAKTHSSDRKKTKLTFDVFLTEAMNKKNMVNAINAVAAYRGI